MKKALSVSLIGLAVVFSVACDNGNSFGVPDDSKVQVYVEREIVVGSDSVFRVFANDFSLNRDAGTIVILMFTCPCYLGWHKFDDFSPVVEVNDQQFISIRMLPGAAYNISERRLESGEERSYYFPLK